MLKPKTPEEDLVNQSENPAKQSEDPVQKCEDLVEKSEDIVKKSDDPAKQSEDPVVKSEDLVGKNAGPLENSEDVKETRAVATDGEVKPAETIKSEDSKETSQAEETTKEEITHSDQEAVDEKVLPVEEPSQTTEASKLLALLLIEMTSEECDKENKKAASCTSALLKRYFEDVRMFHFQNVAEKTSQNRSVEEKKTPIKTRDASTDSANPPAEIPTPPSEGRRCSQTREFLIEFLTERCSRFHKKSVGLFNVVEATHTTQMWCCRSVTKSPRPAEVSTERLASDAHQTEDQEEHGVCSHVLRHDRRGGAGRGQHRGARSARRATQQKFIWQFQKVFSKRI